MEKENKSKEIFVFWITKGSAGNTILKQDEYEPITRQTLRAMEEQLRKKYEIPKNDNLVITHWQRFEK